MYLYLDIKPAKENSYDCFQGLVASVADHFQKDYSLMFAKTWLFDMLEEDSTNYSLGSRLQVDREVVDFEMLKKYHGISIECIEIKSARQVIELVKKNLLAQMPIIIFNDAYYCPWGISYKKYWIDHYCLVIGCDDDKKELYCLDPYMADDVVVLPFLDLEGGYGRCFTFRMENEQNIDDDWREILLSGVNDEGDSGTYTARAERIRDFARYVSEKLDLSLEKKGFSDDFAVPLFRSLKEIGNCRINYAKLMTYIGVKYNCSDLLDLSKEMLGIGELWYRQRLNFIKQAILPGQLQRREKLAMKLFDIAQAEEELAQKIISKI